MLIECLCLKRKQLQVVILGALWKIIFFTFKSVPDPDSTIDLELCIPLCPQGVSTWKSPWAEMCWTWPTLANESLLRPSLPSANRALWTKRASWKSAKDENRSFSGKADLSIHPAKRFLKTTDSMRVFSFLRVFYLFLFHQEPPIRILVTELSAFCGGILLS